MIYFPILSIKKLETSFVIIRLRLIFYLFLDFIQSGGVKMSTVEAFALDDHSFSIDKTITSKYW